MSAIEILPVIPEVTMTSAAPLPDLPWIKSHIPIQVVAKDLDIRMSGLPGATWVRAHCFRPYNHKNGDSTPSLNFQLKKNRFMCFACDDRLRSNIDLVMEVKECSLQDALAWFDEQYPGIPRIKAKRDPGFEYRAGVDELATPEALVRAGLVPHLTDSSLRVFTVLAAFRDESDMSEISYETIKLRTGIGSKTTVARALRHLEGLSLLAITRRWSRRGVGGHDLSQYCFTFDDPKLFSLLAGRDVRKKAVESTPRCTDRAGVESIS